MNFSTLMLLLKAAFSLWLLAETQGTPQVADVPHLVEPRPNEFWMVERNTYGQGETRTQYIFWETPDKVAGYVMERYIDTRPEGSPWTFRLDAVGQFTVYYEHYRQTNSIQDREAENQATHPVTSRKRLKPDWIVQHPPARSPWRLWR